MTRRSRQPQSTTIGVLRGASVWPTVTVNGVAVYRFVDYYQKLVGWTNTSTARFEDVEIDIDPGDDELRKVFIPKTPEAYAYDADGNLTQDGRWNYTWNGENQLVRMQTRDDSPSGLPRRRIDFVYDYMGRRCMKSVYSSTTVIEFEPLEGVMLLEGGGGGLMEGQLESPGSGGTPVPQWELISVTKFVWDGWNLTAELDGEDEIVRTYAWGLDMSGSEQGAGGVGGLLFEQDGDGGSIHRVSMDGNGNVMTLRDSTGTLIAGYEYGPFGEALTVRGTYAGINPFRFSTKYNDPESGLYYYGYRYYSTGMGRWLNRDPIEEASGSNNLYMSMQNAPTVHVDPIGLKLHIVAFEGFAAEMYGTFSHAFKSDDSVYRDAITPYIQSKHPDAEWHTFWYYEQHRGEREFRRLAQRDVSTDRHCGPSFDNVILIGWSNGGATAHNIAWIAREKNIAIDAVITIDPIDHAWNWLIPGSMSASPNVRYWYNVFQRTDNWLKGHSIPGAMTNTQLVARHFDNPSRAHFEMEIVNHLVTIIESAGVINGVAPERPEWRFEE